MLLALGCQLTAGTCELDHVVPVRPLRAACKLCRRRLPQREARPSGEPRGGVMEYARPNVLQGRAVRRAAGPGLLRREAVAARGARLVPRRFSLAAAGTTSCWASPRGATWTRRRCGARRSAWTPPGPHRAHLPPCPAKVFCLSAALGTSRFASSSFRKISCDSPASRYSSASHHLYSTSCSSDSSRILVPRLSLSPQFCAAAMATLGSCQRP